MSMTAEEAAQALVEANAQDDAARAGTNPPQSEAPAQQAETPAPEPQAQEGDQGDLDLKALLEGMSPEQQAYLKERERMLTADYTRKSQAREEEYRARQSDLEFLESLRTDPNAAVQFYHELQEALTQAQLLDLAAGGAGAPDDGYDEFEAPDIGVAGSDPELLALKQELQSLKDSFQAERQAAELAGYEAQNQQKEAKIRAAHESWQDEDIDSVYQLALGRDDGDLEAAAAQYAAWEQRVLERYAHGKMAQQQRGDEPGFAGATVTPRGFESLEDAHSAAEEYLRNAFA